MATLNEIDKLAKDYAAVRTDLALRVESLHGELAQVKGKYLRGIKGAVARAAEAKALLAAAVEETPEQFVKPRSLVLHGIKVGYQKGKGKLEIDDEQRVVKLIRKHFAEQFDVLVKTTEKPVKDALSNLTADELKKLGITVEASGDVVFVKGVDSDVDKLVAALLKEGEAEE